MASSSRTKKNKEEITAGRNLHCEMENFVQFHCHREDKEVFGISHSVEESGVEPNSTLECLLFNSTSEKEYRRKSHMINYSYFSPTEFVDLRTLAHLGSRREMIELFKKANWESLLSMREKSYFCLASEFSASFEESDGKARHVRTWFWKGACVGSLYRWK